MQITVAMKLLMVRLIVATTHPINIRSKKKMLDILFYIATFWLGWTVSPYVTFVIDEAVGKAKLLKEKVVVTWKKYVRKTK